MLMPRAPRVAAAGLLLALAVPTLAACRTSPDVAAYVGDATVTVAELERGVEERLTDEGIAEYASAGPADYTRRVLGFLVEREVYAEVSERYDVEVRDAAVRDRIDQLMGDDDPDDVYAQLAAQGVSRADVSETIRQQLLREELARAEGAGDLSEASLRDAYAEVREEYVQPEFGYITVADEATATAVAAELTAAPDGYAAVAARYPGPSTLPELTRRPAEELPPVLQDQFADAEPGTAFSVPVQELGVVVGFLAGEVYPTFEELREQVEVVVADRLAVAGAEVADEVRQDLDVTVNPRYGVLTEEGRLVRGEGGVVRILADRPEVQPAGPGD
ncbi:peptidyl-prolyl cis-trans isomerase SurA [Blastococcus fimeti]|nr:peptidyl-prolyl cis-trans isomerase SurA [Blastococcus fimeti]